MKQVPGEHVKVKWIVFLSRCSFFPSSLTEIIATQHCVSGGFGGGCGTRMINAPPAFKSFSLFQSQTITINMDTKVPNACSFTINKDDRALGNISKSQLSKDPQVLFAGHEVPYLLEHKIICVQTTPDYSPRGLHRGHHRPHQQALPAGRAIPSGHQRQARRK